MFASIFLAIVLQSSQCRIQWTDAKGKTHTGKPVSCDVAYEWVRRSNRDFPKLNHRVKQVRSAKRTSR
jgi:hypothetical protein